MSEFTVTRTIAAPREAVWSVLDDFGDIQRWNDGVKASSLTSDGPVAEGSTRHCDFAPFGAVDERITRHEPGQRMTIDLYATSKLPISWGEADLKLVESAAGTDLTIDYRYELNFLGRMMKGYTDKQMRKGIAGMAKGLAVESERVAAA